MLPSLWRISSVTSPASNRLCTSSGDKKASLGVVSALPSSDGISAMAVAISTACSIFNPSAGFICKMSNDVCKISAVVSFHSNSEGTWNAVYGISPCASLTCAITVTQRITACRCACASIINLPASIRLASATSSGAFNSDTRPISLRYMRTGSSKWILSLPSCKFSDAALRASRASLSSSSSSSASASSFSSLLTISIFSL